MAAPKGICGGIPLQAIFTSEIGLVAAGVAIMVLCAVLSVGVETFD
jgi:hypothetical protein